MMLWDEQGVYFLTAKSKAFDSQLMEQKYIALSATKDKRLFRCAEICPKQTIEKRG